MPSVRILVGDCRERLATLPDQSVHCCVTSPPYYGLRDYGVDGQIGLEQTPDSYVAELVAVFREVRRVLRDDGTLWLNLGDSYATGGERSTGRNDTHRETPGGRGGSFRGGEQKATGQRDGLKPKDLIGIPWRVAFALQADGWYLRSDIIWAKPNAMPESVKDRPTRSHEYLFLLAKSERYFYDADAIAEDAVTADPRVVDGFVPKSVNGKHAMDAGGQSAAVRVVDNQRGHGRRHAGFNERWDAMERAEQHVAGKRNKRDVWTVSPAQFAGAHFATFPPALIEPCILAGCPRDGTVLDPFGGAGTTGLVADRLGRNAILCELNPVYAAMAAERIRQDAPMFADVTVEVANA